MGAASTHDRSRWDRRDEERAAARARLLARIEAALPRAREVLAAHGVREAWLHGSTVRGHARPHPDVDVAVDGCDPARFYRLAAELERTFDTPLDLLDLDRAPAALAEAIRRDGRRILP